MPRVTFINRYFYPDHSATSQLLSDLAFGLASRGWDVEVVTSGQIYDDAAARLPDEQTIHGVRVRRMPTTRFGRLRLAGRLFDYLSFHLQTYWHLRRDDGDGLVVAMTDPPLIGSTAALAMTRSRDRLVLWHQDLFPEVAMVDLLPRNPTLRSTLERFRDLGLRKSACSVVLGERMKERIAETAHGQVDMPFRVEIIDNWALDESAHVATGHMRGELGLEGAFVVGYSGNFGRVHQFDSILGAARLLREDKRIRFLMTGAGPRFDSVKRFVDSHQLDNVILGPYQPRARLGEMLATSDIHLIALAPGYDGLVVPSKFYGIAASGRPSLYVGDSAGDVARLIERWNCGVAVPSGDADQLALVIRDLSNNEDLVRKMGRNGRDAWERNWTRTEAIDRWNDLLTSLNDAS